VLDESTIRSLSEAIVGGALSLAKADGAVHEPLLASSAVRSALAMAGLSSDPVREREMLCRLAASLAREVLPVWSALHPDELGPARAVAAVEGWVQCPCEAHAELASAAASEATDQSMTAWSNPEKEAAWAGRTAAWAGDAPRFTWQAVAAIVGACRATSRERILTAADRFFLGATRESRG
jgi:hypothetical protein